MNIDDPRSLIKSYFACGCMWGAQHMLNKAPGAIYTTAGYMGDSAHNLAYTHVSRGLTLQRETIEVAYYDPHDYHNIVCYFFEIHDFSEEFPSKEKGVLYNSTIFYQNITEKVVVETVTRKLIEKGFTVQTELKESCPFYPVEEYYQHYYAKRGLQAESHKRRKIF